MTFNFYMARKVLAAIMQALGGLVVVVILLDTVELMRRTSGKAGVGFTEVMEMALLKMPEMAQRLLPFAVLIGAILAITRLTRQNELVVARAAGISVWQFLRPAWGVALVMGVLFVTVMNPIASAMLSRFEQLEAQYISGRASLLSVSDSGLWVRDYEENAAVNAQTQKLPSERIFHASRLDQKGMILRDVILFRFDGQSNFTDRIDAESAQLSPDGYWKLKGVKRFFAGKVAQEAPSLQLPTQLTMEQIQDSFASPETLSFWELPHFISLLEAAGFSALRHKLHFHITLSMPLMLAAMIFIAATFSLRSSRRGGGVALVVAALVSGFVIFFLSDIVHAMGLAGTLSVYVAAWIPPLTILFTGIWLMLQIE